jgi:hypothetical protein
MPCSCGEAKGDSFRINELAKFRSGGSRQNIDVKELNAEIRKTWRVSATGP